MKNLIICSLLLLFAFSANAQKAKTIKEKGISEKVTYEQRLERGIDKKFVVEEEKFDEYGRTVELKQMSRKGTIELWEKFKYDADGNVVEEIQLDLKGEQKKRIVTKYKNGLKVEREYYDEENRMYRVKTYEYKYD